MLLADCHVGIDGIGLIGGSLASSLAASGSARSVRGWDTDGDVLLFAEKEGIIGGAADSLEDLVKGADLLILAVPLEKIEEEGRKARSLASVRPMAVMDVGSAKASIMEKLCPLWGERYLGFHPMAGKETGGVANASPDLFRRAVCALVPGPKTSPEVVSLGRELAESIGADTVLLGAQEHDGIVACTSHAPILLAMGLALAAEEFWAELPHLPLMAAGGFRDTSRLAGGPSWLVSDLWTKNGPAMRKVLDRVLEKLAEMRDASPAELSEMADRASAARIGILERSPERWRG